jgi:SRSO17 transposase
MAATLDPVNTRSKHQALHHFVADSPWSDQRILDKAWQWVEAHIPTGEQRYLIVDDTGIPKKGTHSVGVSHQYCGQLYLPKSWSEDRDRCDVVGVPEDIRFSTKSQIALSQLQQCHERGIAHGIVLANAAYGNDHSFREGLDALGLSYVVGTKSNTSVWGPGVHPIKPTLTKDQGRQSIRFKYTEGHRPESVKTIAMDLKDSAWQYFEWRSGTNDILGGWFTALRVRVAHRDNTRGTLRAEHWLLVEWPEEEEKPTRYWLSNLPKSTSLKHLVYTAKMRWHIERDYQELKDELGLNHYEGRNWRGFHPGGDPHHATLCITAYAYLVAQRIEGSIRLKKNTTKRKKLTVPNDYIAWGSPEIATACW